MDRLLGDVRIAVRTLAKQRHFTLIAVAVLALGIGVTTAVFSVVNAVLLRPLPYVEPGTLVAITSELRSAGATRPLRVVALDDVAAWRTRTTAFASMGAFAYTQLPMRVGLQSFSPVTALMDPQFLPTIGNPLALGSFFDATAAADSDRTAIISHSLWTEAFGRAPDVLGRAVVVNGELYEVRGVLAADFQFPRSDASYYTDPVDLLIPAATVPGFPARSRQWWGIARLAPGVTMVQAEAELRAVAEGLSRDQKTGDVWSVRLTSLQEETSRRARQPLLTVLGIAVVLLLIALTNLMNLFFSRGVTRLREMSIRRAIGSTTAQLVRQLVMESVVLAAAGGAVGVWLAALAVDGLVALSPVHLPVSHSIDIDAVVLAFTAAVCLAAALVAGLFPALHVSVKSHEAVRNPGFRASASRGVTRVQQALCVAQIALGVALLSAAGLLANSLWRLATVDPGFHAAGVLGFDLSVPADIPLPDRKRFYARALEEVRTIPGVATAGLISFLPPETRAGVFMGLAIDGVPSPPRSEPARVVNTLVTSPGYFETMGTPLARGRGFTEADAADGRPVIVVNEALVRRYLPAGDAIGRRIGTGFDGLKPVREIVGVVRDSHDRGVAAEPVPTVYIPFQQFALPYSAMALRTALPPESVIPVVRDRLRRLNASVPVTNFQTVDERLSEALREPRFYTVMAAVCAGMAVLFVTLGLYGLISYSVSRRIAELGIRMAVGAQRAAILRMVLLHGLRLAIGGAAIGVGLAVLCSRALRSLLFQVQPLDPATFSLAAAVVVSVTLAASYVPARRASRVDPITALRCE
jgi:putative ABC transport system permease protein